MTVVGSRSRLDTWLTAAYARRGWRVMLAYVAFGWVCGGAMVTWAPRSQTSPLTSSRPSAGRSTRRWSGWPNDGSRRLLASATARSRDLGDLTCEAWSMAYVGLVDAHAGAGDSRLDEMAETRERALHAGVAVTVPWLDLALAVATASTGRLEEARERLQAQYHLPALHVHVRAWTGIELAEIKRLTGDGDAATADAEQALELAGRLPKPWLSARARNVLGRVAAAGGDWGEADRRHHEALDAIADGGFRLELPAALEAHAHVAAGMESSAEAARLLGAAAGARHDLGLVAWPRQREEVETLTTAVRGALGDEAFDAAFAQGAELSPDDAVAWVRRAPGSRKRPSGGWEALTPIQARRATSPARCTPSPTPSATTGRTSARCSRTSSTTSDGSRASTGLTGSSCPTPRSARARGTRPRRGGRSMPRTAVATPQTRSSSRPAS